MDWAYTWEYLSGQGIMFWTATVAVALGITLILTAGHLQWRRLRRRTAEPVFAVRAAKRATNSDPEPDFLEKEQKNNNLHIPSPPAYESPDPQEMGYLMARLRIAADRLAGFQSSRLQTPSILPDSHLKEDRPGVEYLFRAGKG